MQGLFAWFALITPQKCIFSLCSSCILLKIVFSFICPHFKEPVSESYYSTLNAMEVDGSDMY